MMLMYAMSLALAVAPFNVEATIDMRGLYRGKGSGHGKGHHSRNDSGKDRGMGRGGDGKRGGKRMFLQDMMEIACPIVNCEDVGEDFDCNIEKPERPDLSGMTYEERQDARTNMEATKKENRQQILQCACCTDATIEDLIPPRDKDDEEEEEDEDSSSLDLGHGHSHHKGSKRGWSFIKDMTETVCPLADCSDVAEDLNCDIERPERPDLTGMTYEERQDTRAKMEATKKDHGKQILECACCTDATIEDLIPPREEEEDEFTKIDIMLGKHCPKLECPSVEDADTLECARLDSDATRQERRHNILNCICCQNDGVEELQEQSDVEVSVLLASLLTEESVVQTQESHLVNPATHFAPWSVLTFAAAVAILAVIV